MNFRRRAEKRTPLPLVGRGWGWGSRGHTQPSTLSHHRPTPHPIPPPQGGREMNAYAELAVTTNFSFLRGASHPQEMVAAADELGLAAIGIADRNSFAGVVRAYDEWKKRTKPQAHRRHAPGRRSDGFEVLAYPTDRAAYGRLCRLLTARQSPRQEGRMPSRLRRDSRRERGADAHRPAAAGAVCWPSS